MNVDLSAALGVVFGLLAAACAFVIRCGVQAQLVVSPQRHENGAALGARHLPERAETQRGSYRDMAVSASAYRHVRRNR